MKKPSQAIEIVSNEEGSNDLLLCGIDGIEQASHKFSEAQYYNYISSDSAVSNVFGLGEQNKFFYTLMSFRDNEVIRYESGTGYGYEKDGKQYFCRYLPLYDGKNPTHRQLIKKTKPSFSCSQDSISILTSSVPEDYAFIFYDANCLLSSVDKVTPRAIQVLENSFLARISVNDLSNVSFDSKEFSNIVAESLTKYNKQLSLKTSKLNANKLSVKQLQLEPTSDLNVKKGTFVYDEESDTVKFFNGTRWRTLVWAENEE
jgi:hypothetical protein